MAEPLTAASKKAEADRAFILKTLANNPELTKRHFSTRCGLSAKLIDQIEQEGVKFGDPTTYQQNARKWKL